MTDTQVAPYGSWKSPITSEFVVSETIGFAEIMLDGDDVYWLEMRPQEAGRYVVVRRIPEGQITDITPPSFNVRTLVHELGGGAYVVDDGTVFFSNFNNQRIYRQDFGFEPYPITTEDSLRFADGIIDKNRHRMICIMEDHTCRQDEAVNTIVSLILNFDESITVLASGNDFYSSPQLSMDGSYLAWLTWNHPHIPWHGTELWLAELNMDGSVQDAKRVAGGINESIFQPKWSPDGALYFVSDRTGWWNLYRWRGERIEHVIQLEAEFGLPQWYFRMSTYSFESAKRIICTYAKQGRWHLASINTYNCEIEEIETPYTDIESVHAAPGYAVFIAGSPTEFSSIVQLDLATYDLKVLRSSREVTTEQKYLSIPEAIEFPTARDRTAHAFFYAPMNGDFVPPSRERPPLLVMSHGGPTYSTRNTLNLAIQYWTSHGIAVLDVNYGGSTGYGRAYCRRLRGQWGIVDVDDCVNGARYLVARGDVDGDRLAIRGGSAGGYTTLCALTFRDVFKAGASYFGISDLKSLAKDTHKFESHYLQWLIGPYPECVNIYFERSPINFVEQLSCPVIFFQGLDDKIVPPSQAEKMFQALRVNGLPVSYLPFEGEQHGFRRAENMKRALDAELYFYSRAFDFVLAELIDPVYIANF